MKMQKTLESVNDLCIRFTEEEIEYLSLSAGDKFSCKLNDDGSIIFEKYKELDIELDHFTKEELIKLIVQSVEKNITIEELIEEILESVVSSRDCNENFCCGETFED